MWFVVLDLSPNHTTPQTQIKDQNNRIAMRIVNTAFVLALASSASAKLNNPDENRDLQFEMPDMGNLMGNVSMPEMPDMGDLMGNVSMPEMPDMEGMMNATADMAESAIASAQEAAASAQEAIANATAGMMEGAQEAIASAQDAIANATAGMGESSDSAAEAAIAEAEAAVANATATMGDIGDAIPETLPAETFATEVPATTTEEVVEEPGSAANVKLMITSASVVSVAVLLNAL